MDCGNFRRSSDKCSSTRPGLWWVFRVSGQPLRCLLTLVITLGDRQFLALRLFSLSKSANIPFMHWLLHVLYFLLLLMTDIVGLVLAAFTLPGLWLILAGAAMYAALTKGEYLGLDTLILLLVLTVSAEIAELVLGSAGAKKAGASRWGMLGGLAGGILGGLFLTALIPIPILGTVIGICLGSFAGAFIIELGLGQAISQSALIGYGAAKGKFSGILSKLVIGLLMFIITFCMALPVHLFSKAPVTVPAVSPKAPTTSGGF